LLSLETLDALETSSKTMTLITDREINLPDLVGAFVSSDGGRSMTKSNWDIDGEDRGWLFFGGRL